MGETGPHWAPHGGPNIWRMGDFAPMGAPISIDGGTVMPMGETNGQRNVLLYEAELVTNAMGFPHGLWYNGNGCPQWNVPMGVRNECPQWNVPMGVRNGMSPWGNSDPRFHLYMGYDMKHYDYLSAILSSLCLNISQYRCIVQCRKLDAIFWLKMHHNLKGAPYNQVH